MYGFFWGFLELFAFFDRDSWRKTGKGGDPGDDMQQRNWIQAAADSALVHSGACSTSWATGALQKMIDMLSNHHYLSIKVQICDSLTIHFSNAS